MKLATSKEGVVNCHFFLVMRQYLALAAALVCDLEGTGFVLIVELVFLGELGFGNESETSSCYKVITIITQYQNHEYEACSCLQLTELFSSISLKLA